MMGSKRVKEKERKGGRDGGGGWGGEGEQIKEGVNLFVVFLRFTVLQQSYSLRVIIAELFAI